MATTTGDSLQKQFIITSNIVDKESHYLGLKID